MASSTFSYAVSRTYPFSMVYTRCFHWWRYCTSAFLFTKFRINRLYSEVEETLEV